MAQLISEDISPTVLIPAAGFGKRLGTPPAKELLPDADGKPWILWGLEYFKRLGWKTVVITRQEKTELLQFLAEQQKTNPLLSIQTISPSREWPDTLLQSAPHWGPTNLVWLPDTRTEPVSAFQEIARALTRPHCRCGFGLFDVETFDTWGVIDPGQHTHCEKPGEPAAFLRDQGCKAWGCFGFQKEAGLPLLKNLLNSTLDHQWRRLPEGTFLTPLRSFVDLSRS